MNFLRYLILASESLATAIAFMANITLMYCILYKTPEDLKDFSKILRQNCIIDLFLTFCITMTFFMCDIDHGEYIIFLEGPFSWLPHPWSGILCDLYVFALYFCISSYCIPFIYRYLLFVKGIKMKTFKFYSSYLITGFLSFLIAAGVRKSCVWPGYDDNNGTEYLHGIGEFWKNDDGTYPVFVASHLYNPWLIITIWYCFILISGAYLVIFFCCYQTILHLKNFNEQMNESNKKLQRQLTYALLAQVLIVQLLCPSKLLARWYRVAATLVQAMAPLAVGALPLGVLLLAINLQWSVPGLGVALITTCSWVTFLNPLCALTLVGPYRDFLLRRKRDFTEKLFSSRWGLSQATTRVRTISGNESEKTMATRSTFESKTVVINENDIEKPEVNIANVDTNIGAVNIV